MKYCILTQVAGESPGLMELFGIYDDLKELNRAIKVLKERKVPFSAYGEMDCSLLDMELALG